MVGDSQPKTKAELLRELQSIRHLLDEQEDAQFPALNDDDIPLLEEFLDMDESDDEHTDRTMQSDHYPDDDPVADTETLEVLNAAYAALTGDLDQWTEEQSENTSDEKAPEAQKQKNHPTQATPRAGAPSHAQQIEQVHPHAQPDAKPQPDEPKNSNQPDSSLDRGTATPGTGAGAGARLDQPENTDSVQGPGRPLPGQQNLFDGSDKKQDPEPHLRPGQLTKATGENPFLPQHIRERLRGNQPMPTAEFLKPQTPPAYTDLSAYGPAAPEPLHNEQADDVQPNRHQPTLSQPDLEALLDEVMAEILPLVESRLRQRLMEKLTHEDPTDH